MYYNHTNNPDVRIKAGLALILKPSVFQEDLLRIMSSYRIMVPGFRWRRSRWGRTCPVALKEGKVVSGKPQFSVG